MEEQILWGDDAFRIEIDWSATTAPRLARVSTDDIELSMPEGLPLIEVLAIGSGHEPSSDRLVHTTLGQDLRYVSHSVSCDRLGETLAITAADAARGVEAVLTLFRPTGVRGLRATVQITNTGRSELILRSVASLATYLGGSPGDWTLFYARSCWLGENRWEQHAYSGSLVPGLAEELTGSNPRGELRFTSEGYWSTGRHVPVGAATSRDGAWAWQVEHNGPWRWEVGRDTKACYLAGSGPTHMDHGWLERLGAGEAFISVPMAVMVGRTLETAMTEMTRYRRATRRPHPDNASLPVVFNDYMNTLRADPTTAKLRPLVEAAARAGVEIFCIDAGWYDDGGDWWESVGEWRPSTTRFPNGLSEIIGLIRAHGMVPGLWLEPEVIGINSPAAQRLPAEAFVRVGGIRVVENRRFHLDLRHPAARAHLDSAIDRLTEDFGIGYFKLDHNIDPITGSDVDADSTGAALLAQNRAHLAWLEGVLDRHPGVVLENCASGAMRADWAILSRLQLQSTSDQQDHVKYPVIAASAPMLMLPEQAANWAYPQPEMTTEEIAFCLVTGLAGRFYLSGQLDRMTPAQLHLVSEAVAVAKRIRRMVSTSTPFWPLHLPSWTDRWVALGFRGESEDYVALWSREAGAASVEIALPDAGEVQVVFPTSSDGWEITSLGEGRWRVSNGTGSLSARLLRVGRRPGHAAGAA